MTGATPETDALCSDPAIERRDVPARVWREMARIEFERDALRSRNAELVEAAREALSYCSSEAIGTVQEELQENKRICDALIAALAKAPV